MNLHQGFYHQFKGVNIHLSHYLPKGLILFYISTQFVGILKIILGFHF